MATKLSHRQVNTWRLGRQHLLSRAPRSELIQAVSDVCGVHAQVMSGAAMAIWARVDSVKAQDVEDELWKHRRLVKTWCMRGTLHLLPSEELPLYVAALKTRTNYRQKAWLKGHGTRLDEIDKITEGARASLDGRILTREELVNDITRNAGFGRAVKQRMLSGWGSLLHPAAYKGYLCFGPSRGKNVTFVRPDQWLGKWDQLDSEEALKELLRRFIARYGPCSHRDFGHWWGVPESSAKKIFASIVHELEEVEFSGTKVWMNKGDAEQCSESEDTPSVRMVPSFDPYVMFYGPRESLVEARFRTRVFRQLAGWNSPVLLVDGVAAGIWQYMKRSGRMHISVEQFRKLTSHERQMVESEAAKLGEFHEAKANVSFAS